MIQKSLGEHVGPSAGAGKSDRACAGGVRQPNALVSQVEPEILALPEMLNLAIYVLPFLNLLSKQCV